MLQVAKKQGLELVEASDEDARVLDRLIDYYCYDYSEFDGADIERNGRFDYIEATDYLLNPNYYPYLIKWKEQYAGFALVQWRTEEKEPYWYLADYFVMRKYRKDGIGKKAASLAFNKHPGVWEVRQDASNIPAQKFWQKVLQKYTRDTYRSITRPTWDGPIQRFTTQQFTYTY